MNLRLLCLSCCVVFATGCSTLGVKVDGRTERAQARETRAVLATAPAGNPAAEALRAAQPRGLDDAGKLTKLVEAARIALRDDQPVIYNAAVGQIVTLAAEGKFANLPPGLKLVTNAPATLDPTHAAKLVLASSVRIKGLESRTMQDGLGVPYVAWYPQKSPWLAGQPGVPPAGMATPVTAVVTFRKGGADLRFVQTLKTDSLIIDGRKQQLAADFSASIAVLLAHGKNRSIDIRSLFLSNNLTGAGLYQFQPYDPKKVPVVFVHGLLSRPEAWTKALNGLLADKRIREHYQFWFFLYPTGLPVWRSAAILRSELDRYHKELETKGRNPNLHRMVIVGHSMGGLISSLMVREGGDRLWKQFSDVPASSLKLRPEAKKELLDLVYFAPRKDISRVIFVAVPHRGSYLAVNPVVGFISNLIRLPFNLLTTEHMQLLGAMRPNVRALFAAPTNSLVFLRAQSPLLLSILNLPMKKGMPYHSIIGDRGRGDTPNSSDGVVPYWSSHLDGAVSEKIVPSGHGANENAQGIEEMRRILVLNAGE